jgi:hypothetical protein
MRFHTPHVATDQPLFSEIGNNISLFSEVIINMSCSFVVVVVVVVVANYFSNPASSH